MNCVTDFFSLLTGFVGESKALLKEYEELFAVLLDEFCRKVLQYWAKKLTKVARGLRFKYCSADCLSHDFVISIESSVNSHLLVSLSFHADGVKND